MLVLLGRIEQYALVDGLKHGHHAWAAAQQPRQLDKYCVDLLEVNAAAAAALTSTTAAYAASPFAGQTTVAELEQDRRAKVLPGELHKRRVLSHVIRSSTTAATSVTILLLYQQVVQEQLYALQNQRPQLVGPLQ